MVYNITYMEISIKYDFFEVGDGNLLTLNERIEEALNLLIAPNDYLQFDDGSQCCNREELREVLRNKGFLG
jgi:hypothetical protein